MSPVTTDWGDEQPRPAGIRRAGGGPPPKAITYHHRQCPYCDHALDVQRESKADKLLRQHIERKHPDENAG